MQEYTSRLLGILLLFISTLAVIFLLMIPLSFFWGEATLLLGWFFGPLLLMGALLVAALYVSNKRGAR